MDDACLVWHYGGKMVNNNYIGGKKCNQIVDTDKLGYWCLLDHAKGEVKETELIKLYFRNNCNDDLVEVHDDAIACQLLTILNENKQSDIYVVNDNISKGASNSRMYTKTCGVNYMEGSSGCRYSSDVNVDRNELQETAVHINNKEIWQFKDLLAEIEVGEVNEFGEVGEADINENEIDLEEVEEEYVEVSEEFMSDRDDLELQEARKNLRNLIK